MKQKTSDTSLHCSALAWAKHHGFLREIDSEKEAFRFFCG